MCRAHCTMAPRPCPGARAQLGSTWGWHKPGSGCSMSTMLRSAGEPWVLQQAGEGRAGSPPQAAHTDLHPRSWTQHTHGPVGYGPHWGPPIQPPCPSRATRSRCPGPRPEFPGTETPPPPWAACASVTLTLTEKCVPGGQKDPPRVQFVPVASGHDTGHHWKSLAPTSWHPPCRHL